MAQQQPMEQQDTPPHQSEEEDNFVLESSVSMEEAEEPLPVNDLAPEDTYDEDIQGPQVSNNKQAQQADDTRGLGASRHAPEALAKVMQVDNAKEMLALTATWTATRKQLLIIRTDMRR